MHVFVCRLHAALTVKIGNDGSLGINVSVRGGSGAVNRDLQPHRQPPDLARPSNPPAAGAATLPHKSDLIRQLVQCGSE